MGPRKAVTHCRRHTPGATLPAACAPRAPYRSLLAEIGRLLEEGRTQAYRALHAALVQTYWAIGKQIVEFEQEGRRRALYGGALLERLSADLRTRYGAGFSKSNVYLMRQFYLAYPKFQPAAGKLGWSHYAELLSIGDGMARRFYERQCLHERWSRRELRRQIGSALFERLALSKDKRGVLRLARTGQLVETAADLGKDPCVLEFLDLPERGRYTERQFEQNLNDKLPIFLLELGKGFTFVKRQYRVTLDNKDYYVDLVFYHRILRCFVLIDLKLGKVDQRDIGQMNMYLNYFNAEERARGEREPIGLVLAADKNSLLVEYALGGISNKLFVSTYKLYLPDRKKLERRLQQLLAPPPSCIG